MMRVAKATTFRASMNSTSHITVVGVNIVDPFRTSAKLTRGFHKSPVAWISGYFCHRWLPIWIPALPVFYSTGEECRRLRTKDKQNAIFVDFVFAARRIVPEIRGLKWDCLIILAVCLRRRTDQLVELVKVHKICVRNGAEFYFPLSPIDPLKALPEPCARRSVRSLGVPDEYIDWMSVTLVDQHRCRPAFHDV